MRLLLDTHTLVWALAISTKLPPAVVRMINDQRNHIHYSVVSLLEIAIKRSPWRRSTIDVSAAQVERAAQEAEFIPVVVKPQHAVGVEDLPPHHGDPFDRLLVAQALAERLRLVTRDETLSPYSDTIITY